MTTLTTWEEAFHAFIAYIPFMVPVSHLKGAKPSDHVLYPPTNLAQGVEQWSVRLLLATFASCSEGVGNYTRNSWYAASGFRTRLDILMSLCWYSGVIRTTTPGS